MNIEDTNQCQGLKSQQLHLKTSKPSVKSSKHLCIFRFDREEQFCVEMSQIHIFSPIATDDVIPIEIDSLNVLQICLRSNQACPMLPSLLRSAEL